MNNEQEIINNYLKNNPLKSKQRKQDRVQTYPCVACGAPVFPNKKRPATPFTGGMLDKFDNKIEDFPIHEEEDMCNNCKGVIRNTNMSVDSMVVENNWDREYTEKPTKFFTENLDAEQLETENNYQGYSSLEDLEGLCKDLGDVSEKPLKL